MRAAIEAGERQCQDRLAALELELEEARYQARLAARRYEAVDPDRRLVAAELEARWNEALERVAAVEGRLNEPERTASEDTKIDKELLKTLAADLASVWDSRSTEMRLKQRIARLLIQEISVDVEERDGRRTVVLMIYWVGGRHSELRVVQARAGEHGHRTHTDAEGVIRRMAGAWTDQVIASTLNRLRFRTGMGNTWTVGDTQTAQTRRLRREDDEAHVHSCTGRQTARRRSLGGQKAYSDWRA